MLKVLIADDEPKIRKGLLNSIDWAELDMEVVGLARDGEEAYGIACREKPDICLVDICMPFINGLDLIDKIKEANPRTIAIVITGYDKFEYAQRALKIRTFDYLLKPINEDELLSVIKKAKYEYESVILLEERYMWAEEQLKKNMPLLKQKFIQDWIKGCLTKQEIVEQLNFHGMSFSEKIGVLMLKYQGLTFSAKPDIEWEKQILLFTVQNIFEEVLKAIGEYHLIRDDNDNFAAVVDIRDTGLWDVVKWSVEDAIEQQMKHRVTLFASIPVEKIEDVADKYEELSQIANDESRCLPLVRKVKTYIERNYKNPELSLQGIADEMQVSLSHLSKLFKQEVGMSFIDFLIKVRISHAIQLMNDPLIKIYEISDAVGYNTQHYFCTAFKKLLGVSPMEFKSRAYQKPL